MTKKRLSMTEVARIAQHQRALALKQQDSAPLSGLSFINDDDSHLDLTTRTRFLEACGGPPPYVLERIDASGNVDRYPFERPFLIVGRSPTCDVACLDRLLSFRHIYLQYLNGVVWWFDLDSRSGIESGGKKRRAGCLLPGMTIAAGDYSFRLADTSQNLPVGPAAGTGQNTLSVGQHPEIPQVALEFENGKVGKEEKQLWPVENSVSLLGRRSCCDLRFKDESVSRVHAGLVLTNEGLWIVDLLGRGGTKVNGLVSAYAYLHDGSLIELGPYKIRVRYSTDHMQPHPAEAILNEEDRPSRKLSQSQGGSVSEDLVYDLVTRMAEMQQQMFEQSQMQIGLLVQLLGSIHQGQQDMLRNELDRVNVLTREINDLKLRLTVNDSSARSLAPDLPRFEAPVEAAPPGRKLQMDWGEGDSNDSLPAPTLFAPEETDAPAATGKEFSSPPSTNNGFGEEPPSPRPKSTEIQDHAVLFQRMQSLDRERNGRLQKILRAFRGS